LVLTWCSLAVKHVSRIIHAFLGSSKMKFRRLIALICDNDVMFFFRGRRLIYRVFLASHRPQSPDYLIARLPWYRLARASATV
jgi:hypothetical protein